MSYDIEFTEGNDISVTETGDLGLATSKSVLARQWVQIRLRTILTEWFLDQTEGIAWVDLLSRKGNQLQIDSIIKRTITQTQYINRLLTYSSELDKSTQKYSVTFSAEVEDGEVLLVNNLEI